MGRSGGYAENVFLAEFYDSVVPSVWFEISWRADYRGKGLALSFC